MTTNNLAEEVLLKFLRSYVLDSIGALTPDDRGRLQKLDEHWKATGHPTWSQFVEAQMDLPPNAPELIRANWSQTLDAAKRKGVQILPEKFAEEFVKVNFLG